MRRLRNYQRVANKEHFCDSCCDYINPGEMYEGQVYLDETRSQHRITVYKWHVNPMCDPPEDPLDEGSESARRPNTLANKLKNDA
jgi:hypothetical protein